MGRRGVCWDNAAAESFFSAFKLETLYGLKARRFDDAAQARGEIFRWIAWYNTAAGTPGPAAWPPSPTKTVTTRGQSAPIIVLD